MKRTYFSIGLKKLLKIGEKPIETNYTKNNLIDDESGFVSSSWTPNASVVIYKVGVSDIVESIEISTFYKVPLTAQLITT